MNHYHLYRLEFDDRVVYEYGFNDEDALENAQAVLGRKVKPRKVRKANRSELIDGARQYVR